MIPGLAPDWSQAGFPTQLEGNQSEDLIVRSARSNCGPLDGFTKDVVSLLGDTSPRLPLLIISIFTSSSNIFTESGGRARPQSR